MIRVDRSRLKYDLVSFRGAMFVLFTPPIDIQLAVHRHRAVHGVLICATLFPFFPFFSNASPYWYYYAHHVYGKSL